MIESWGTESPGMQGAHDLGHYDNQLNLYAKESNEGVFTKL